MSSRPKNYRVSIAATLPANFEFHTKASGPEEAYVLAMHAYDNGGGHFQEIIEDRPPLATGEPDPGDAEWRAPGVYIAEIDKKGNETEV